MRRRLSILAAAATLVAAVGVAPATTLAIFTKTATSTGSITAGTLAPPTGLGATGGSTVTLTWTPSVSPLAAGYGIYRSATSGSGYALVASVTPGTLATATDSPGAGTWYYVLKTTYASWASVNSNQATATVTATSTAYKACVTSAADTVGAGDNNGYETTPAQACTSDNLFAVDSSSGTSTTASCGAGAVPDATKDRHQFYGYVFGLPGSVAHIDGIRVQTDLKLNAVTGTTTLCAQLSSDGGTTWTTIKTQAVTVAAKTTYIFGATNDTWGRTWALADFGTTTFRVRVIDASTIATRVFSLDYLAVSVTYAP